MSLIERGGYEEEGKDCCWMETLESHPAQTGSPSASLLKLRKLTSNIVLMNTPAKLLRHIRFRDIVPFTAPQNLQNNLARQFLDLKAAISSPSPPSALPPTPIPTIISFTPQPVYTTGRREHGSLTDEQLNLLKRPLSHTHDTKILDPEVWPTQRGGQTTFHGPGQLVLYPTLDLKAKYPLWPKGMSPRCYVNLLEQTTINTLARWGLKGIRTENPGVWEEEGERKIAALGVHLRRNITSYGVGLNVNTDLRYFDRIVACGLVGKKVTSMSALAREKGIWGNDSPMDTKEILNTLASVPNELASQTKTTDASSGQQELTNSKTHPTLDSVAAVWVDEFMKCLFGEETMKESKESHDEENHDIMISTFERVT